ncbi:MAG: PEP-CTERM sorting domain-containing protein [Moraxellaceae bacterium]|nr:PEP-CTERM sorting domain-containing protein [Moraxellaceae bacterium]
MKLSYSLTRAVAGVAAVMAVGIAQAAVSTVPQTALVPSDYYYTDLIGGGIGNVVVTTGGGASAPNIGDPSGRNDDGFSFLNLGFNVTFFGNTYSSLYINNNGNVSFGAGISAYVPVGPTGAIAPVISPFFGDVDTRNAASGVVHVRTDIANQVIVTWDQVGYYSSQGNPLNSFQLVLRGDNYVVPVGEGSIGFFYQDMGWENTQTSTTAAVGFGDGQGNGKVLEGSNTDNLNLVLDNHHIWFDPNLNPVSQVPEPGALALLGIGLLAGFGARARKSA